MTQVFFIAGTDTGVGKTTVAVKLLAQYKQQGYRTVALKPVASGCEETEQGLRNDDALQLQQAATEKLPYDVVNPFAFAPAIAPHIAAKQLGKTLSAETVVAACQVGWQVNADICLIEGAGGWHVPLNSHETLADVVLGLNVPVILVVAMRLGCLNHALLTYQAMVSRGVNVHAWVANVISPEMPALAENIDYLRSALPVPLYRYRNSQLIPGPKRNNTRKHPII